MKTHTLPISAMGFALFLCACDKEAELALRPSVATFSIQTVSYSEKDGSQDVPIAFSKPANEAGTLSVAIESQSLNDFTFLPAPTDGVITLQISQGSSGAVIKVAPIDNDVLDGTKVVSFVLGNATRGIQVGSPNRLESTWIDDESPSRINFAVERGTMIESSSTGSVITLELSHAVPGDGQIEIDFSGSQGVYGADFTTLPEAVNGTIVLPVHRGASSVSFTIDPKNDALFNADRKINFNIKTVSSVFEKGSRASHEFTITDDELGGRAKSYATSAGNGWSSKRQIYYTLSGSIERVAWENNTPGQTGGEYRYLYNDAGQIEKVIVNAVTYIKYIRENGRIIKAEEYDNEELDRYTLYGYDHMGNIGEVAIHDRQKDGSFAFSLDFVYLYFNDGNLYKKMAYNPAAAGEPALISTDTYEHYVDGVNPFPIEIIHGQPIQNKLPGSYHHESESEVLDYSFSYQFLQGSRPSSRTATGPGVNETTYYEYY
ncbi:MAG: hypothetical protein QM762_03855 [Chryseolinea sp.]